MLQQEATMDPCPRQLRNTYRINSTRTAEQIEQEDNRVVANFIQHLVKDQAKAQKQERNITEGGEGDKHQDTKERGKKKETDLQRIYNAAVANRRVNQETQGRSRNEDTRGTGTRGGNENQTST